MKIFIYTVQVVVSTYVGRQILVAGEDAADEVVAAGHRLSAAATSGCGVSRLTKSGRGSLLLAPEDGVLELLLLLTGVARVHRRAAQRGRGVHWGAH